ncbi:hypothetical protein AVEN_186044-1 [Araneus ventricosus]|uniref:Uncharacterized protein n=1 Tax=Araneus ventricosus TaxID=182803 RepID=A0A4Y2QGB2_ARAVE|nr:hypothetical protein AVEN_271608-1 [Araneus ventricosus]GBN62382.1 hypothetical protein AVEN_186044-1 [Araneus ventricosus]
MACGGWNSVLTEIGAKTLEFKVSLQRDPEKASEENNAWRRLKPGFEGRSGLVVRSRPRDWRTGGWKHDSTEDPPCMGPVARQIIRSGQTSTRWCGAEV